jgi:hypothetical protein
MKLTVVVHATFSRIVKANSGTCSGILSSS